MYAIRSYYDEGADIIDIGGESTRPGSERVAAEEQMGRVIPVIEAVHAAMPDTIISIDTTLSAVAKTAIDAGATIINDISAGREDDQMFRFMAASCCPCILMHMQGAPGTMQDDPRYVITSYSIHYTKLYEENIPSRPFSRQLLTMAALPP